MIEQPHDLTTVAGRTTLWIDSSRIDPGVEHARAHRIGSLGINAARGYGLKDIEFVRTATDIITDLTIVFPPGSTFDLTPLYSVVGLRSLVLSESAPIDLSRFPALEEFSGPWRSGLGLESCAKLRTLGLGGFKSKLKNLVDLPVLTNLRELRLTQANITTLQGLERFGSLTRLELNHLRALESLSEVLALPRLEALCCLKCPRLRDYDVLRASNTIRVLRLNDCADIGTLEFIASMSGLEEFRFVNTNIVDGNLRPLLRLKWVGFLRKRHYSHTPEEVDAVLRAKGGGALPRIANEN